MRQANKKELLLRLIPAGIYNSIIWYLSSIPLTINLHGFDKSAHILEYSGLGFLLAFGFRLNKENFDLTAKSCLFFGISAGIIDEIHQYFVPGRSSDFIDILADITGISLGILSWLLLLKLLSFLKINFFSKTP